MEGSENTVSIGKREEPPKRTDAKVSDEIWQDLLHTAIVGNGIFPQSLFAQGVLLADEMASLVNERKASLASLQEQNPPGELISTMFQEAKSKSHNAYGFKTASTIMGDNIENLWRSDKAQAQDILVGFSEVIGRTNVDAAQESKVKEADKQGILRSVFSNPQEFSLLLELLGVARQSLLSQEVREISKSYKEEISKFMQRYSQYNFRNVPLGYTVDTRYLSKTLKYLLADATGTIKKELIVHTERQHPENKILLKRLKESETDKLFGRVTVAGIHPLLHPDYE